jgi:hypothetical protein
MFSCVHRAKVLSKTFQRQFSSTRCSAGCYHSPTVCGVLVVKSRGHPTSHSARPPPAITCPWPSTHPRHRTSYGLSHQLLLLRLVAAAQHQGGAAGAGAGNDCTDSSKLTIAAAGPRATKGGGAAGAGEEETSGQPAAFGAPILASGRVPGDKRTVAMHIAYVGTQFQGVQLVRKGGSAARSSGGTAQSRCCWRACTLMVPCVARLAWCEHWGVCGLCLLA